MICYRDMSFCADQDECANDECRRKLTEHDKERAIRLGLPIAWMSFRPECTKFKEKK